MISPQQLIAKANRLYPKAIKAWLHDDLESHFPCRISVNLQLAKGDVATAIREVDLLRQFAKETRGFGYSIHWERRQSRSLGLNDFPAGISIDTMDDLLRWINKESEWKRIQSAVAMLRSRQPRLNRWLCESVNWKSLLEVDAVLDDLLTVVEYFESNPRPDCFARELPLAISTKLIESHRRRLATWLDQLLPPHTIDTRYGFDAFEARYGLRYARPHFLLRILDSDLQQEIGLPFDEVSLPAESLSELPVKDVCVVIVENKVNLLTLPSIKRGLALGGIGNAVTQLSDVAWLHDNPIAYWGDLDADGFVILDRLRQRFPKTKSLLMDQATFQIHSELAIAGNGSVVRKLEYLTTEELAIYQQLCQTNQRLEQERIPQSIVIAALAGDADQ